MLGECLCAVRGLRPLVHCVTNYVTANDCANLLLACGASPIMADAPEEAAEITANCAGLVLNLGTPNPRRLETMLLAGREANRLNHPVVFDPVGAGASEFRRDAARTLLKEVRFTAIRGNVSEIEALSRGMEAHRGVDADARGEDIAAAVRLARTSGAVVAMTGTTDIVTDGSTVYRVSNGHAMMRAVTGAGCMLSALTGAFAAANPDVPLKAALSAVCAMGVCGERARAGLCAGEGNATYRNRIIDAMYNLDPAGLEGEASYEVL